MIYCKNCGFGFCERGNNCANCAESHYWAHSSWFRYQQQTNPYMQYDPGLDLVDSLGNRVGKFCGWCECRINVTEHICFSEQKSYDWLDLLARLKST